MRKPQILINEPVYLDLSKLNLSKTVMYKFWHDYVKLKYWENAKLCYMDTERFIVHEKKKKKIYKDTAEVQAWSS